VARSAYGITVAVTVAPVFAPQSFPAAVAAWTSVGLHATLSLMPLKLAAGAEVVAEPAAELAAELAALLAALDAAELASELAEVAAALLAAALVAAADSLVVAAVELVVVDPLELLVHAANRPPPTVRAPAARKFRRLRPRGDSLSVMVIPFVSGRAGRST
jgi:hypothetical protein